MNSLGKEGVGLMVAVCRKGGARGFPKGFGRVARDPRGEAVRAGLAGLEGKAVSVATLV